MNEKKLIASGVCKAYGKKQVLNNLDLTIEPGRIYGLIGRNGAGKTTLLSILTAQNTKNSGSVEYGGEPVWENANALADICFSREIAQTSPNGSSGLKVKEYLRAASIFYPHWDAAYAAKLVELFDLPLKKSVLKLSKGMCSMLTIVIALASRAAITMLDEPVAGLDIVARQRFYELLLADYQETNRTFIISTHIIEEAQNLFEEVIVLDEGVIIEKKNTDELLDEFRLVSGREDVVDAATKGLQTLQTETMGRHKAVVVRGNAAKFAQLTATEELDVSGINLQKAFLALCGHGEVQHV